MRRFPPTLNNSLDMLCTAHSLRFLWLVAPRTSRGGPPAPRCAHPTARPLRPAAQQPRCSQHSTRPTRAALKPDGTSSSISVSSSQCLSVSARHFRYHAA